MLDQQEHSCYKKITALIAVVFFTITILLYIGNLEKYAVSVAQKIRIYLAKLSDKMLSEKLDGCEFTRLELLLGQFRHVMCHAGISSAINAQNGNGWLKYFGLD